LTVPAAVSVALVGMAACPPFSSILENGCGDNKPPCEVYCVVKEYRDAGVIRDGGDGGVADAGVVECPLCANDQDECPVGCEPSYPFT
jgi:hypothetical protein